LRHAPDLALDLFEQLGDNSADDVLATSYVHDFLRYRGSIDYERLSPIIRRMIESTDPEVRTAGAVQATLAALNEEKAGSIADHCVAAKAAELRLGSARVYGANLTNARHRAKCEAALTLLFDDENAEVRKAASEAVSRLRDDQLLDVVPLIRRFLDSRAFCDHPDAALHAMEFADAPPPDLSLDVCERVMNRLSESAGIADRDGALAHDVSELLVRAYADAGDPPTLNRALDLIDSALQRDLLGAYRALREHDR
jgi:hypothetical protein